MSNDFESFSELPEELQREAIREGEAVLHAQFQAAIASDSRALAWGGLIVASATGALGAGLALLGKSSPDYWLAAVALAFSVGMVRAAWIALSTVRPKRFSFPGNEPQSWLPANWDASGSAAHIIRQARTDQAKHITSQIRRNALRSKIRAKYMHASFNIARHALIWGAGALLVIGVARAIPEPAVKTALSRVSQILLADQ